MKGYFWADFAFGLFRRLILRPIELIGAAQDYDDE